MDVTLQPLDCYLKLCELSVNVDKMGTQWVFIFFAFFLKMPLTTARMCTIFTMRDG